MAGPSLRAAAATAPLWRGAALAAAALLASGCVSYFRPTPDVLRGQPVAALQARHYAWAARNTASLASSVSTALFGSAMAFAVGARVEAEGSNSLSAVPILFLTVAAIDLALGIGLQVGASDGEAVALAWEARALAAGLTPTTPR